MCSMRMRGNNVHGFTVIELMIVVAIISILSAIIYPAYQGQVRDTRRADAASVLMDARQKMERHYTKHYSYANPPAGSIPVKAPVGGSQSYYTLAVTSDATTYTITATAQGDQASDGCGDLSINQAGVRTAGEGSIDDCWR